MNNKSVASQLISSMMKKRLSNPCDNGRPFRRASSAPLSVICRSEKEEGKIYNSNHSQRHKEIHNQIQKKKMKKEKEEKEEEEEEEKEAFGASEECGARERLQRYRVQVAGSVWIPDAWDQEERLKEWVDPIAMDRSLAPDGLLSARSALIHDCISNRDSSDPRPPPPPVITCSQ